MFGKHSCSSSSTSSNSNVSVNVTLDYKNASFTGDSTIENVIIDGLLTCENFNIGNLVGDLIGDVPVMLLEILQEM